MQGLVRWLCLGIFIFSTSTAFARDCSSNLASTKSPGPTTAFDELLREIKETVRHTTDFNYDVFAKQLLELRDRPKDILGLMDDDQEGIYRDIISLAFLLNQITVYVPIVQELISIHETYAAIEVVKSYLIRHSPTSYPRLAEAFDVVLRKIDALNANCEHTLQTFYQLKGKMGESLKASFIKNALNYAHFSDHDWNNLYHKINQIPAYISSWQYQLGIVRTELQNGHPNPNAGKDI